MDGIHLHPANSETGALLLRGIDSRKMSGPHASKFELPGARVYIHVKDEASGSTVTHIDVEHPALNEIIEPDETSFVGGKEGGVFLGLKRHMIERAEAYVDAHERPMVDALVLTDRQWSQRRWKSPRPSPW